MPKPRKITMARNPLGYDTFGPVLNDGIERFIVYRPAESNVHDGDPGNTPFALLDRGDIGANVPSTLVVIGDRQFTGRRTYWETKREIREEYSTVETQQEAGILPPAKVSTNPAARFTKRDEAASMAKVLSQLCGQPFTVMGDGPEHGTVWIVAYAAGPGAV